jgi:hypothetical protein
VLIHIVILASPVVLFLAQLTLMAVGSRYRRLPTNEASNIAVAPVVGTILSLMGLVLAFSFSDAERRLDANRQTILNEANAIEAVYLSIRFVNDLPLREQMYTRFRQYVDARVRAYQTYDDQMARVDYDREIQLSSELFMQLWSQAVEGTSDSVSRSILLNALNAASSTATSRALAMNTHMPPAVIVFLVGVILIGALLVGVVLAQATWSTRFYRVVFAAVLSWTAFAIFDMEYPRLGAFQLLRNADALLVDLRKSLQ